MADFSVTDRLMDQLTDTPLFKEHILSHINHPQHTNSSNIIVQSLAHINDLLDMYAGLGFCNIKEVYDMISVLPDMHCNHSSRWQTCMLSGIMSKNCLILSPKLFLAPMHEAWFNACWLLTHMHMLEKLRRQSKNVTELNAVFDAHVVIYQQSILRVLRSLLHAFPAITYRAKVLMKHMQHVPTEQATQAEQF